MFNLKNKNILVTGGAGFVGGHLVEELVKLKANVIVADINFDKKSYLSRTYEIDKKCVLIKQDICDYKKLLILIKKYKINFIFHLAAQALVEDAYINPKYTLENNIISTINVLEAVRLNPQIKGVVVASSDKAYGKLNKNQYIETDPLSGDHPYDTSKSVTDLLSTTYYKTYKIPVVVTRFGNIYGEGDLNFSRIIPGIMESIIKNSELRIRSNGKYVRDYLYVKDVVNGYLLLAQNIETVRGEVFNFGSDETLTVIEVIKLVEKILNKKINYKILNTAHNEIPYQSLDYSKIKKSLGWKPKENIKSTVEKIFSWYKNLKYKNEKR
ncbi:putative sugar dehydratase/epimerase YfnG [Candidatus Roizmanbacteria bacterium]|nr:putative sugar dehydratase/epimerase YfnG [Candidatus Roizmanbacteria bacterium]